MIRLSGGTLRGRVLKVSPGGWIRPTMGRVREAIFSMLAHHTPGATVLDLFAGCGLLGLEALSRGAHTAFFVDLEPKAVQLIKQNVALCGMETVSTTQRGSAILPPVLQRIHTATAKKHTGHKPFDLIFLDPPYHQGLVARTLQAIEKCEQHALTVSSGTPFLAKSAIIITEQEANIPLESTASWRIIQDRRYGETRVTFWQSVKR